MSLSVAYVDHSAIGYAGYDYLFKCLVLGDSGVGKTSITDRLVDHHTEFDPSFISTIGVDFRVRTFHVNGKVIKLQIWDTSGQERFRSITSSYYRGANGIIMAYDLTDPRSLRDIESLWLKEVDKYASPEASLLMVGNKRDLESSFGSRVDSTREMAKDFMRYCPPGRIICNVETSAKTGWGVEDAFLCLVEGMLNKACDKELHDGETHHYNYKIQQQRLLQSKGISDNRKGRWGCC